MGATIEGIYSELRRLERAGLVSSRDNDRGESPRHAYELTAAGQRALREWLTDPRDRLLEMRHEALRRLRFAGVLPPSEQLELVRRMRYVHERRVSELEGRLAAGEFDDPLHRLTVEFGVGWNRWAREWCLASNAPSRATAIHGGGERRSARIASTSIPTAARKCAVNAAGPPQRRSGRLLSRPWGAERDCV